MKSKNYSKHVLMTKITGSVVASSGSSSEEEREEVEKGLRSKALLLALAHPLSPEKKIYLF